jgi:hypothetical protein
MDSAAPAAHVDNLMDSQKAGCPQVTHNRLDKSIIPDLSTGAWITHNAELSTLSTISATTILFLSII